MLSTYANHVMKIYISGKGCFQKWHIKLLLEKVEFAWSVEGMEIRPTEYPAVDTIFG